MSKISNTRMLTRMLTALLNTPQPVTVAGFLDSLRENLRPAECVEGERGNTLRLFELEPQERETGTEFIHTIFANQFFRDCLRRADRAYAATTSLKPGTVLTISESTRTIEEGKYRVLATSMDMVRAVKVESGRDVRSAIRIPPEIVYRSKVFFESTYYRNEFEGLTGFQDVNSLIAGAFFEAGEGYYLFFNNDTTKARTCCRSILAGRLGIAMDCYADQGQLCYGDFEERGIEVDRFIVKLRQLAFNHNGSPYISGGDEYPAAVLRTLLYTFPKDGK